MNVDVNPTVSDYVEHVFHKAYGYVPEFAFTTLSLGQRHLLPLVKDLEDWIKYTKSKKDGDISERIAYILHISSRKIGVPKIYLVLASATCVLIVAVKLIGKVVPSFISDFLFIIYPAIQTLETIKEDVDDDEDVNWKAYWVVRAIVSLIEKRVSLVKTLVPYYKQLKFVFFLWLIHPRNLGALSLYKKRVLPLLEMHPELMDSSNAMKVWLGSQDNIGYSSPSSKIQEILD